MYGISNLDDKGELLLNSLYVKNTNTLSRIIFNKDAHKRRFSKKR